MIYITTIFIGFLVAFFGLLAPSMLNMTAAKTSIEKGRKAGFLFSIGASSFVIFQASIAVFFAKYLVANPQIITKLKTAAIFVLFGLSIFFFVQARKENTVEIKDKKGNPFFIGLGMSSLNMLGIPFYLAMATLAESKGWVQLKMPYSMLYVVGAVLGAFSLFFLYVVFSFKIAERASFIATNINYILSGLFIILSFIIAFEVLNNVSSI